MPRFLKQVLYGAFYVLVWAGVIFGVRYAFRAAPPPPSPQVENLSVLGGVQILNATSFIVRIQNPNQTYAAKFGYTLHLSNAAGETTDIPGSSFIYAAEIKYIALVNLPMPVFRNFQQPISRADITINQVNWIKSADFPKPEISVQNFTATTTSFEFFGRPGIIIRGLILNRDSVRLAEADALAIFFSGGKPAAASQTELDNLSPGESRTFSMNHPPQDGLDLSATQVFVYGLR